MNKPSIWYWIISGLGFLWNMGGAYDYLMTRMQNADYMSQFPPELLDYFYNMPLLMDITWPAAVWAGLLGWFAMLLRKSWAVTLFIISFASMIINFVYMLFDGGLALQAEYMGATAHVFTALIILIGAFAVWFSRREKAKGTLN